MDVLHDIETRMEKIRAIFQYGMSVSMDESDMNLLDEELKSTENEFRSIAYEAAAMQLATKDISINKSFDHWRLFMQGPGVKHLTQTHVGLGWAMAQQQFPVFPFIETLEPLMQCRVIDGYGYYEGIFRKRRSIGGQEIPLALENKFLHAYDQGLGRSIWYICKGSCEKITKMVESFPSSRHKDLWRGIGTACAYVGGFDENLLNQLLLSSTDYRTQLSIGAALVSRSRTEACSYTRYIDMACRVWSNCTGEEAFNITVKTEPLLSEKISDPCKAWITNIEEAIVGAKVI
ncbi:MAG: DUF1702 family protein [Ferruginibacter sp.]